MKKNKVLNFIITAGVLATMIPVMHGNAEREVEYRDYEVDKPLSGDYLLNAMLQECGITSKPNTMTFYETDCYTKADDITLQDSNTHFSALFALDESRNLYICISMNGDIKDSTRIPVREILGIGNDVAIMSTFKNDSTAKFKTIKLTPQEYGNNTMDYLSIMSYYDCDNAVEYSECVSNNDVSYIKVPLYSDTFYGATYDSPVFTETFNVPATLIHDGKESSVPVEKTVDISWDGSCKVSYRCGVGLSDGDIVRVSEPLNCEVSFYATNYHWRYSYADEYWKIFRDDTSYFETVEGDIRNMQIEYTYSENGSYLGNNFNFFQVILEPDNQITFDYQLNKHVVIRDGVKNLVNSANNFTINDRDYIVPIKYPTLGRSIVSVNYGKVTQIDDYTRSLEEELNKVKARNEYLESQCFGDVTGDNVVSVEDAQKILEYYTEKISYATNLEFEEWVKLN